MLAQQRRKELVRLMRSADLSERGWRSRLAEELGVHRGTVCRDLQILAAEAKQQSIADADADIDRRFTFLQMLQRSLDPDQTRSRALRDARDRQGEIDDARKSVADYATDHASDSTHDGGDRDDA
tara:strand:- start:1341 stop:1715 length:375 start_codon:yes stop_codon:yes gene_type:complete